MSTDHGHGRVRRVAISAAAIMLCSACAAPDARAPLVAVTQSTDAISAAAPSASTDYRPAWATRLLGRPVIDGKGEHLGKLTEIIADMSTGRVRYAIVSDMHGAAERLVAVPIRYLAQTGGESLLLGMARERFAQQRSWSPAAWPGHDDSTFWNELEHATGMTLTQSAPQRYRLSRLVESSVANLRGEHLGRIVDVVIDMSAQEVHYAILGYDKAIGDATEHAFAVPVTSLHVQSSSGLALDVASARLAALIGSDPAASTPTGTPRYLGTVDRTYRVLPVREAIGATR